MGYSIMGPRKGTEKVGKEWWNLAPSSGLMVQSSRPLEGTDQDVGFIGDDNVQSGTFYIKFKMHQQFVNFSVVLSYGRGKGQTRKFVFTKAKLLADGATQEEPIHVAIKFTNANAGGNLMTYYLDGVQKTPPTYVAMDPIPSFIAFYATPGTPYAGYFRRSSTSPITKKFTVKAIEPVSPLEGTILPVEEFKSHIALTGILEDTDVTYSYSTDFEESQRGNVVARVFSAGAYNTMRSPRTGSLELLDPYTQILQLVVPARGASESEPIVENRVTTRGAGLDSDMTKVGLRIKANLTPLS